MSRVCRFWREVATSLIFKSVNIDCREEIRGDTPDELKEAQELLDRRLYACAAVFAHVEFGELFNGTN